MRRITGFVLLMLWAGLAVGADSSSLTARKHQASQQQQQLRQRIKVIQKDIDSRESDRDDVAQQLKASESAISTISRRLADLADQAAAIQADLHTIDQKTAVQQKQLAQRQDDLAKQLRAEYASGLSPWTALLSGNDPQQIGRDLNYLGYVSRARTDAVRAIRDVLETLGDLRKRSKEKASQLVQVTDQVTQQKAKLVKQKKEHKHVLASIDAKLAKQRAQAGRLSANEKQLGGLITRLDDAIAAQAEARRRAAAKRRAEAKRAAEAKRIAAEKQARAARQQAKEQAAQEQETRKRQQAAQQEAARQQQQRADQSRQQAERAHTQPRERVEPAGGFDGLHKGLPYPVNGDVQGRFGTSRPDGGVWRGIVLRAPTGTPVHVVADGRVVYANWLTGYGNIIIVDHGDKYLSIYAYNQSLLKHVGDIVHAGDTIATVGATGGQVEAGLYFEIRHNGAPVNPQLWLKR